MSQAIARLLARGCQVAGSLEGLQLGREGPSSLRSVFFSRLVLPLPACNIYINMLRPSLDSSEHKSLEASIEDSAAILSFEFRVRPVQLRH